MKTDVEVSGDKADNRRRRLKLDGALRGVLSKHTICLHKNGLCSPA